MWTIVQNNIQIERIRVRKLRQAEKTAREAKKLKLKVQYAEKKGGKDNHLSYCICISFESRLFYFYPSLLPFEI